MKILPTIAFLLLPWNLFAQMPRTPDSVWMSIGDSLYPISPAQTQTETRPGWKIADVAETRSKSVRYVWGGRSTQLAESPSPRIVLKVQDGTLHDHLILQLKSKKQYRRFPKPDPSDCDPIYIDLNSFRIELLPDERYAITPLRPLPPGEYVIVNTAAKPLNDQGDMTVYGFTVQKQ